MSTINNREDENEQLMHKKVRFEGIDFLKCFAILSVVCLHVSLMGFEVKTFGNNYRDLVQIPVITYYFGTMAIPIFFSINGYLILGRKRLSYQYILTKVYHLLLPVFLWSLVGSVSQIYINHIFPNPIESAFLSLLQIGNFNVFWFIGALVIVQLCSPVLHWLMQHRWLLFQGCILFLGIACTAVMVTSYYLGYPVSKNIIQTFRLWTWLFYFMLGAWVRNIKLPVSIEKCVPYLSLTESFLS